MHAAITPRQKAALVLKYLLVLALTITTLIPFLWMVSSSLKYETEVFSIPIRWIPSRVKWDNYVVLFERMPFDLYFLNSLKIALSVTVMQLIFCSMAAFSLTKLRYPGRSALLLVFLSTLMVPSQVMLISQYLMVSNMRLLDTHLVLILLNAFSPFGIFMMVQFYRAMPSDLLEAARIDGANLVQQYLYIVLPIGRSALAALGVLVFINQMNDFMNPMIYLNSADKRTITLGIRALSGRYFTETALQMTGSVCALIPMAILFVAAQKHIINGLAVNSGGGIKG